MAHTCANGLPKLDLLLLGLVLLLLGLVLLLWLMLLLRLLILAGRLLSGWRPQGTLQILHCLACSRSHVSLQLLLQACSAQPAHDGLPGQAML